MNDEIFSDLAIEKSSQAAFGVSIDIVEMIARAVPVGITATGSLFKTATGQIFLYVTSQSTLLLDDVDKIVTRMNLEADKYMPPHAEDEYFERIAVGKFRVMFPGKPISGPDDLRYYRGLAPFNPALVRISKVKGEIKAYDPQSRTWHKVKDYHYNKIKTI